MVQEKEAMPRLKKIYREKFQPDSQNGNFGDQTDARETCTPSPQQMRRTSEEEDERCKESNLAIRYHCDVTPPGDRDSLGSIKGGRELTSLKRRGLFFPEPCTSEKNVSSEWREVKRRRERRKRKPSSSSRSSRNLSDKGSGSGSASTSSTINFVEKGRKKRQKLITIQIKPIINVYLNVDEESSIEWEENECKKLQYLIISYQ